MSRYSPAFEMWDIRTDGYFKVLGTSFPADRAPRSKVKSRYACQNDGCENGPSTGHAITDGYCKDCHSRSTEGANP